MNKKFLKLELDFDFILIALTSQLKDYRLCFHINKIAETNFRKIDELELQLKEGEPRYFSRYLHQIPNSECKFYLIANRGSDGFLIPEMKESDYFILIKEFIDEEDLVLLISQLRRIKDIQAAVEVNPAKLKSKENLLF
ncbi:MAG: IPExxxVDY family protein [Sphingobacteriales bacterium]|nr:IPExxxVDY family protein [Sphingobacteriales bacterium]